MKAGLTIIFACLISFCSAQITVLVKSFEDHQPLHYASVANLTRNQIYFTDENGFVSAKFETGDSIIISFVGYQTMKARIEKEGNQTYFLTQSDSALEPIQIVNCRNVAKQECSNFSSGRKFGISCWTKKAMGTKMAIMLKTGPGDNRLAAFSFWIRRENGAPKQAILAPMIFRFTA